MLLESMKERNNSNMTFVVLNLWIRALCQGILQQSMKKRKKCDICNENFSQRGNLNRHVATVHEEKKQFKCDICNDDFKSKHVMKEHIEKNQKGKENEKFKCDICNAKLGQNGNLKTHVM